MKFMGVDLGSCNPSISSHEESKEDIKLGAKKHVIENEETITATVFDTDNRLRNHK